MATKKPLAHYAGKVKEMQSGDSVGVGNLPIASQAQAEVGTDTNTIMTPQRTAQAITALGGGGGGGVSDATAIAYAIALG